MADDDRQYVALIGDIQGSREAEDRAELQERFRDVVDRANQELDYELVYPLTITTGDEFQAIFDDPLAARRAITWVSDLMAPTMLRFGLGYGPLEAEPPDPTRTIDLDGPCLRHARRGLDDAKKDDGWVRPVGFRGESPSDSVGLEGTDGGRGDDRWRRDAISVETGEIMDAVGALREQWTERQAQVIREFRAGKTGREVADELGLSPSTVSGHRKAARYETVRESEVAFGNLLNSFITETESRRSRSQEAPDP